MSKYTPGPWIVGEDALFERPKSTFDVAFTREAWGDPDMTERKAMWDANARLISAAPDLLESLEALVIGGQWESNLAHERAFAAIRKARGTTLTGNKS